MADEPDDILELTEDQAIAPPEEETNDAESKEEVVVSFGEEEAAPASEEAPEWVRDVRKRNRELERENAELKKSKAPTVPEVGPKPTLAGCDYDEERFESEHDAWKDRKSRADNALAEAQKAKAEVEEKYQAKVRSYGEQKDTLGVADFEDAETEVLGTLNPAQQAILIHGAENKATLVYALGRYPKKLRELASIADPIEFAFAAGRLEGNMKMGRKPATSPEAKVEGSAPIVKGAKLDDRLSPSEWLKRRNEQVRTRR